MIIVFRVDASEDIGTGHVMRCLTLADALHDKGACILFISRDLPGNLHSQIAERGYEVESLPLLGELSKNIDWQKDADSTKQILQKRRSHPNHQIDWLIVDHYELDEKWEQEFRDTVQNIMVIDDLANRKHDCDLILDQNYYKNYEYRYDSLVPETCAKFLGPEYVLLRPEFVEASKEIVTRDGVVKRLLIFFGGSDPTNETLKTLRAIQKLYVDGRPFDDIHIDVVVGQVNPNRKVIQEICSAIPGLHYHCQIDYMAQLMANADLSIGAGGVTMWERCYLGLPSITIVVAENQLESTKAVAERGAIWNMGWYEDVKVEDIVDILSKAFSSPLKLRKMSLKSTELMNSDKINMNNKVVKAMMEVDRYEP
jgi:UDP-2,4-diacetamido-2,4,6-trideoxy-beta-L-altropyranose hydrolase